jgi:hypothetical protein
LENPQAKPAPMALIRPQVQKTRPTLHKPQAQHAPKALEGPQEWQELQSPEALPAMSS